MSSIEETRLAVPEDTYLIHSTNLQKAVLIIILENSRLGGWRVVKGKDTI